MSDRIYVNFKRTPNPLPFLPLHLGSTFTQLIISFPCEQVEKNVKKKNKVYDWWFFPRTLLR